MCTANTETLRMFPEGSIVQERQPFVCGAHVLSFPFPRNQIEIGEF